MCTKIFFLPSAPNIFVLPMCKYSSSTHVHQQFCSYQVHQIFLFFPCAPNILLPPMCTKNFVLTMCTNYFCSSHVHQIFFFHPCAPKILFLPSAPNIFVLPMCTNYSSSTHVHQIFFFLPGAPNILFPVGAPGSRPLPRTKPWNLPPGPAPGDRSGGKIDLWSYQWSWCCSKCLHQDAD